MYTRHAYTIIFHVLYKFKGDLCMIVWLLIITAMYSSATYSPQFLHFRRSPYILVRMSVYCPKLALFLSDNWQPDSVFFQL